MLAVVPGYSGEEFLGVTWIIRAADFIVLPDYGEIVVNRLASLLTPGTKALVLQSAKLWHVEKNSMYLLSDRNVQLCVRFAEFVDLAQEILLQLMTEARFNNVVEILKCLDKDGAVLGSDVFKNLC